MKGIERIVLNFILFLIFTGNTFAQLTDSIDIAFDDTIGIESNFNANLDSVANLWYVGESVDTIEAATEIETVVSGLSDEILIDRINSIPGIIPLSYNTIVRRYIEMYTGRRAELVCNMLGLAEYYFPVFDHILDYHGLPNELKYLSVIESALNPRAYSRARAAGIWQFMYGTGKMYGLTINSLVDERLDPFKSTHAAARFLKDLYGKYNDWILAIAAYNCGPGNVNRAIRRSGGKTNYWDLYFYLPRETRGYVPAFIAAMYVMNFNAEHNLYPKSIDLSLLNDTIMVTDKLHLEQVSKVLNIPMKQLRDMNPQYRADIIPGSAAHPFALRLPEPYTLKFIDYHDSIFAFNDSVYFNNDKLLTSPTYYTKSSYYHEPPSGNMSKLYYTVKSGDNLGYIAEWYHVRVSDLRYWNNIRRNLIRSGQKLVIYVPRNKAAGYSKINNMTFAEKQKMIGKDVTSAARSSPDITASTGINFDNFIYYTVREGDTLWDIAKKYPGISDDDIKRLNNINDVSKIKPGQRLKIKPKT
ncbi:MAG: transglycosylase SLT domain-containing protein [Bacteroidales bacterium]|nr:transglycosylase SLT domain-containing protein [Bacteroidales bacterium]